MLRKGLLDVLTYLDKLLLSACREVLSYILLTNKVAQNAVGHVYRASPARTWFFHAVQSFLEEVETQHVGLVVQIVSQSVNILEFQIVFPGIDVVLLQRLVQCSEEFWLTNVDGIYLL